MSAPSVAFAFKGTNPAAQRVAARQAARLVTNVSLETLAALRAVVVRAIREGIPPYDAARIIRELVGMTTQQAQAAMNYREELIDQGLPLERVNTLVDRYAAKKIRERAETIARTEIMDALNEGSEESWREAQAEGLLGDGAKKEWMVAPDDRLCPSCEPMDGVAVPLGDDFSTPLGKVSGPPLHPNCRCTTAVIP